MLRRAVWSGVSPSIDGLQSSERCLAAESDPEISKQPDAMKQTTTQPATAQRLDIQFQVPMTHRLRFTQDVLGDQFSELLALLETSDDKPARVQFWLDETLLSARPDLKQQLRDRVAEHPQQVQLASNVQVVPGGEAVKNDVHILERMLKVMNAADLDRRSYVIVIGGGAVLDAVGFAAAIAHRGIRLIRLPTTTLGQADSGVGVKNSINLFHKKNWVGTFATPWAVINDAELLETLPDRDFRAGFSEAVKVALLKETELFEFIHANAAKIQDREWSVCEPVIRRSAEWHIRHITQGGDPFEALEARPLDFGHWSAHKLEVMSDFELRHGEAVAIGLAIDVLYSKRKLGLSAERADQVLDCLRQMGILLSHPTLLEVDTLFGGLEEFRQHLGGRLTLTMLTDVGKPLEIHEVDDAAMRDSIRELIATVSA
ncbi:3-dehydroquinate synthase [Rubinisphaera brasiliensis]|uniref:3-dehydroquinate synthase n=1 Tax=Rubinisphaera brasiliensis (strain ATCC 49424 / DSM 5305 / JCM 21570 / IAM 15109 / NBRC 103401 / IFAM 1448) TaxID=756272 RepID=F0SJW2_RUBBR|nr:3-dehydroquinate synthase [Rubinisphaera brasiliensis]ADY58651.1 3-dehydroquinate synthase [Rubinisphaera brasiliensis DSM 5305]